MPARAAASARTGPSSAPRSDSRASSRGRQRHRGATGAVAPAPPPPALPVAALVDDDAVDPGLEAAAALEAAEHAEDLEEDLLGEVARLFAVAQQAGGQVEDHPLVEAHQPRERLRIALPALLDEAALEGDRAGQRSAGPQRHLARGHRDLRADLPEPWTPLRPAHGSLPRYDSTPRRAASIPGFAAGRPRRRPPSRRWPGPRATTHADQRPAIVTPAAGCAAARRICGCRPGRSPSGSDSSRMRVQSARRRSHHAQCREHASRRGPRRCSGRARQRRGRRGGAATWNSGSRTPQGTKRASMTMPGMPGEEREDEEVAPAERVGEQAGGRAGQHARDREQAREQRVLRGREALLRSAAAAARRRRPVPRPRREPARSPAARVHERPVGADLRHQPRSRGSRRSGGTRRSRARGPGPARCVSRPPRNVPADRWPTVPDRSPSPTPTSKAPKPTWTRNGPRQRLGEVVAQLVEDDEGQDLERAVLGQEADERPPDRLAQRARRRRQRLGLGRQPASTSMQRQVAAAPAAEVHAVAPRRTSAASVMRRRRRRTWPRGRRPVRAPTATPCSSRRSTSTA